MIAVIVKFKRQAVKLVEDIDVAIEYGCIVRRRSSDRMPLVYDITAQTFMPRRGSRVKGHTILGVS
jgi:hypothetical protein